MVAWRVALWHPELISHLFVVCTPYVPPSKDKYIPRDEVVKKKLPNFGYQIQLASGEVEKHINDKHAIAQALNGLYGGKGKENEYIFTVANGFQYENIGKIQQSPLLSDKVTAPRV